MDCLRSYIFSVVIAAFICGILSALVGNNFAKEGIRLLSGLWLILTVFSPLKNIDFNYPSERFISQLQEAKTAVNSGQQMRAAAITDIITGETEAYILDKASLLGTNIDVKIILDENQLPKKAIFDGSVPLHAQQILENVLVKDLGISKENQIWTG